MDDESPVEPARNEIDADRMAEQVPNAGTVACYACAEPIRPDARKCRWCGEWFDELVHRRHVGDVTAMSVDQVLASYAQHQAPEAARSAREADAALLRVDKVVLEVGVELAEEAHRTGALVDAIDAERRRIAAEYGVIVPVVHVREATDGAAGGFAVLIKGDPVATGKPSTTERDVELAAAVGAALRANLAELLEREEVAELLHIARQETPMAVQELVPNMLSLGQLRQVLQNLVRERVPIRDMSTILNALADTAVYTKDPNALTEHVRTALGRKLCARYRAADGTLKAFALGPDAERAIQDAIQLNETGQVLMLDPNTSQAIRDSLAEALSRHRDAVPEPVVVAPPKIRRHVKRLLERDLPDVVVLSYAELVSGLEVEHLGTIEAHGSSGPELSNSVVSGSGGDWLIGDGVDPQQTATTDARDVGQ